MNVSGKYKHWSKQCGNSLQAIGALNQNANNTKQRNKRDHKQSQGS